MPKNKKGWLKLWLILKTLNKGVHEYMIGQHVEKLQKSTYKIALFLQNDMYRYT